MLRDPGYFSQTKIKVPRGRKSKGTGLETVYSPIPPPAYSISIYGRNTCYIYACPGLTGSFPI